MKKLVLTTLTAIILSSGMNCTNKSKLAPKWPPIEQNDVFDRRENFLYKLEEFPEDVNGDGWPDYIVRTYDFNLDEKPDTYAYFRIHGWIFLPENETFSFFSQEKARRVSIDENKDLEPDYGYIDRDYDFKLETRFSLNSNPSKIAKSYIKNKQLKLLSKI